MGFRKLGDAGCIYGDHVFVEHKKGTKHWDWAICPLTWEGSVWAVSGDCFYRGAVTKLWWRSRYWHDIAKRDCVGPFTTLREVRATLVLEGALP